VTLSFFVYHFLPLNLDRFNQFLPFLLIEIGLHIDHLLQGLIYGLAWDESWDLMARSIPWGAWAVVFTGQLHLNLGERYHREV
jgi:hypothetical protein